MQTSRVEVFVSHVEYRRVQPAGILVVKVFLHLPTPRVSFYTEDRHEPGRVLPASLFVDELAEFVKDAQTRIRK